MTNRRARVPDDAPILAAVDGSAPSYRAAAWAGLEAKLRGRCLHLLVSRAPGPVSREPAAMDRAQVERLRAGGEGILAEAVRIAQATMADVPGPITTEVTFELITPTLLDRSARAWMVVVGSRGRGGISRTVVGSLSSAVAAYARCPVTVVSELSATDPLSRRKPVLVGVDGSPDSEEALEVAFTEASYRGVGLVAVRSWSDTSGIALASGYWDTARGAEEALLGEYLADRSQRFPDVKLERLVRPDAPARTLVDESERAQLLVIGRRGRGGAAETVLGATSVALLYAAQCPLLLVYR